VAQSILLIDDCQEIHDLVRARLEDEPVELHIAPDGEAGLRRAVELNPDLILLDVEMPAPDGFEVCRRLKEDPRTMQIPIIFFTSASSIKQKIRGLDLGAVDYVTKPFEPEELQARVRASLRTKYLMDLLARKAMIDGLTGLFNRAYFDVRLSAEAALARRTQAPLSAMMLDVDHFKKINDRSGHLLGDEVLRGIGQIITEGCRAEDTVCRFGGEEFVILCPNTAADATALLAERLRQKIQAAHFVRHGQIATATCSIGVAGFNGDPMKMVEAADKALYAAKQPGRNRVILAEEPRGMKMQVA
jgi:diguanylate cyclase (GGDEF)-like protein